MPNDSDWMDELYREGAIEEPPAELDRRIIAAAGAPPAAWYRRRGPLTGLSTAAVLMLAITLMTLQSPSVEDQGPAPAFQDAAQAIESKEHPAERKRIQPASAPEERPAQDVARFESDTINEIATGQAIPATTASPRAARGQPQVSLEKIGSNVPASAGLADSLLSSPACEGLPDKEAEVLDIGEDEDRIIRLTTSTGQWRCVDGEWQRVPEGQAESDQQ